MNIYLANIQKYQTAISKLTKDLNNLSSLRLITFLFSAALIVVLANGALTFFIVIVAAIGFGALVKRYNELDHLKQHNTFLKEINEQEILKLQNKLTAFSTGQQFLSRDHSFISDLDIFGRHSLFQLINRTTTESAEVLLAEWLSVPVRKM